MFRLRDAMFVCAVVGLVAVTSTALSSNLYDALGVTSSATQEDIEAAYKRVAQANHPDVDASPQAAERFDLASKAFQVLGSPDSRSQHDRALAAVKASDAGGDPGQLVPADFKFRGALDVFDQHFPDTVVHVAKQESGSSLHMSTSSSSSSSQQVHTSVHMATSGGGASQAAATSSTTKIVDGHKLTQTTNVFTDESGKTVRQVQEYVDDELVKTSTEEVEPEPAQEVAGLPAPEASGGGTAVASAGTNALAPPSADDFATRVGGPSADLLEKLKSADAHRSQFQQDIMAQHNAQLLNHQRMMAEHQERMREHQERMKEHMAQMQRMRQGEL